jgi:hypothetical protein
MYIFLKFCVRSDAFRQKCTADNFLIINGNSKCCTESDGMISYRVWRGSVIEISEEQDNKLLYKLGSMLY